MKINADKALFFVDELKIRSLPTVVIFNDGIAQDKIVGFEGVEDHQAEGKEDVRNTNNDNNINTQRYPVSITFASRLGVVLIINYCLSDAISLRSLFLLFASLRYRSCRLVLAGVAHHCAGARIGGQEWHRRGCDRRRRRHRGRRCVVHIVAEQHRTAHNTVLSTYLCF